MTAACLNSWGGVIGSGTKNWTHEHEPYESLWIGVIWDCMQTAARCRRHVERWEGITRQPNGMALHSIKAQIDSDAIWMGEPGEESDFWRIGCGLRFSADTIEMIRERWWRDAWIIYAMIETVKAKTA